jgi:hypothetical protein
MPLHIVMDHRGDTRHVFELSNARALADAEARFKELTGKGYRAVRPGKEEGQAGQLLSRFDPNVNEVVFIPPLEGG